MAALVLPVHYCHRNNLRYYKYMQVLLIEPDKVLAATYMAALKQAGHTAVWQSSAQGAIAAIDEQVPNIIVLEVNLAKHNGIEFLFELRSYEDLQDIPVILLTTVPEHDLGLTHAAKTQLGITAYLYKPHATLADIVRAIQAAALV